MPPHTLRALLATAIISISAALSTQAQIAPTPDTTFSENSGNLWVTPANWDNGVPAGDPLAVTGDNAKIGDNQTALWQQNLNGDPAFGTLTLGVGSTLRYQASNNQGLPNGSNVYFSNGSHLQYISGSSNRDDNFFILPGADASFTTANSTFFRGTLEGSGNLDVTVNGNFEIRKDTSTFTGDLTITNAASTGRQVWLRTHGGGSQRLGQGVNTIGDNLYVRTDGGNRIPDNATLRLVGGPGASAVKYRVSGDETIANLIIESPTQTLPYMITGNGTNSTRVRVTDTVTFQGTAGTIEIQSEMGGEIGGLARNSGVDILADNFVFGTGDWTINGTKNTGASGQPQNFAIGSIGVFDGGTVTTAAGANVTVNAAFDAPNGFTKAGDGTLTLNHTDPVRTVQGGTQNFSPKGIVTVNGGTLRINNTIDAGVSVNSSGTLAGNGTISGAVAANNGGTVAPGNSLGELTITGGLTLNSGSTLEIELANPLAQGITPSGNLFLPDGSVNPAALTGGTPVGPPGLVNDRVAGDVTFASGSTLQVLTLDSLAPANLQKGLAWQIIAGSVTGNFSLASGKSTLSGGSPGQFATVGGINLDLPDLWGGNTTWGYYNWDLSQFQNHGILVLVPEPSRPLLLAAALTPLLLRRRRPATSRQ